MITTPTHVEDIWYPHTRTAAEHSISRAALEQTDPHLLRYLTHGRRLKLIKFTPDVTHPFQKPGQAPTKEAVDGTYQRESRSIDVRLDYTQAPLGVQPGQHDALTNLATTAEHAAQRVLTHELAHHVWHQWILPPGHEHTPAALEVHVAYQAALTRGQAVSPYALTGLSDYWAETITALIHEPRVRHLDPHGLTLCQTLWERHAP